jgi:hypothetical protein
VKWYLTVDEKHKGDTQPSGYTAVSKQETLLLPALASERVAADIRQ